MMFWTRLRSITNNSTLAVALFGVLVLISLWKNHYAPKYVFIPKDVQVTIPEGTNLADVDRILSAAGVVASGSLLTSEYLGHEGSFFPDTYRFDRDSSPDVIVLRMETTFNRRTADIVVDSKTLIIASILEKEVRTENDMRMVAGIIEKRLDAGMPLQIDATVAYGACLPKFQSGAYCDVSQVNLVDNIKRDSAYNTYARRGLPIGPISNPGLKALRAALSPQKSDYWYYLNTTDGTSIFSRTLEEHNRARARYLR